MRYHMRALPPAMAALGRSRRSRLLVWKTGMSHRPSFTRVQPPDRGAPKLAIYRGFDYRIGSRTEPL